MSKISRSTYQKVVEQNKRLLADIKILVSEKLIDPERTKTVLKWREHFQKEQEFNKLMKQAAISYIKKNPDDPAVIAFKEITENGKNLNLDNPNAIKHRWIKSSKDRNQKICKNCGIIKDETSSHHFYIVKGNTVWGRPDCIKQK